VIDLHGEVYAIEKINSQPDPERPQAILTRDVWLYLSISPCIFVLIFRFFLIDRDDKNVYAVDVVLLI
jgi:hypothetical protein